MHPVETYLRALRENRAAGVPETSNYGALQTLLDAAGAGLKPRVRCVLHPQAAGAGIPDAGLFTADQLPQGEDQPAAGMLPARGAVEAKAVSADVRQVALSNQVTRYVGTYGQVLVTSLRDWTLVDRGADGRPVATERFRMAESEQEFWRAAANPHQMAGDVGDRLIEYLQRVMLRPAPLVDPKDVARLLAAYAHDALFRVERGGELAALAAVRESLEQGLGITFRGEQGDRFFRSTLVQTLFYGMFSAWTIWSREGGEGKFDWRTAVWHLQVPVISALFGQIATPNRLGPLGVVEVLDWAADGLNRVVRDEFFRRFSQEHAVQYFYEPFLQAFDPELRRELGVWYTPPEVVKYMVERVDQTLRSELNIADGLADPRVLVLDPCCGTGAYLVEVLRRIATTLSDGGEDAMLGMSLLEAAVSRVYGFEILPAPFVVAHLQIGLLLRRFGVQPSADHNMAGGVGNRRVGVFLTNSLTGWGPPAEEQKALAFPELQAEHNAAEHVKRDERILVVIGNPPYNGYPGLAMQEERDLVEAYRTTQRAPRPQGQGLNDLYVRFFRMAERRIVEMTRQGIVCLISNYLWLDGLSHTGMRERYMEAFDRIWIDSLNGDKYRTGKLTPDGEPDPSVFSTEWNREGIQVGTAVSLLVRADPHSGTRTVQFRNFWGRTKRVDLLEAVTTSHHTEYEEVTPVLALGLPFIPGRVEQTYFGWPRVPDVFPVSYSGVQTRRDELVIDTLREELVERLKRYFDPAVSHREMRQLCPRAMTKTAQFDPEPTRDYLRRRGPLYDYVVRYLYRPFDVRWVYWEPQTGLLGRKVPEYFAEVFPGNRFLFTTGRTRKPEVEPPVPTTTLTDLNFMDSGARGTPLFLSGGLFDSEGDSKPHPNLSAGAARYLGAVGSTPEQLFDHAVAMLHSPAYQGENAAALRQDWPRVPLPAEAPRLLAAAALGRQLAALLDPERQAAGVTTGAIRPELRVIASPMHVDGGQLSPPDFALTAGWGRGGTGGATMPGRGRAAERAYTDEERAALSTGAAGLEMSEHQMLALLGETCFDVYLNDHAFWRCVPVRVWEYTLGGYQVIKKWLSYREEPLLGRPLRLDEVREVTRIARRITAILLMEPALDDAYAGVKAAPYAWE